jgi:hypothetical protein
MLHHVGSSCLIFIANSLKQHGNISLEDSKSLMITAILDEFVELLRVLFK